jgi:catechol 2,3-dioxygenase-like lactoylglutathione lyase family enzyme
MSEARIEPRGVHHVAYTTRDAEATYDFYTNKLGMPLLHTENHLQGEGFFRHFFFGMGNGESIAFFEVNGVGEEADYKTDISTSLGLPQWANHIAFKLNSLEELDAMIEQLHERGLDEMLKLDHGWCTSVYLNDPNGIMVEFCVTTDAKKFQQTEEEALRLMRLPAGEIGDETRKERSDAERA